MSSIYPALFGGSLDLGETGLVQDDSPTAAGSKIVDFSIQSDNVLVSLYGSIIGGTLDVSVYTVGDEGHELLLFSFPQLTAPTVELLLKKSAATLSHIRIKSTWTGASNFSIRAKAIGSGESSVKILGAGDWKVSKIGISGAALLIAADLTDRAGLVVKNHSLAPTLYLAETLAKATVGIGYPLGPGEAIAMDLAAGQELYAISSSGTVDVRIIEGGG